MVRSRFIPGDPGAVHERFERVKARALRRLQEESHQLGRIKPEPPSTKRIIRRPKKTG
jgi:hypothetical protein